MIFSADEAADVGIDLGTQVVESTGSEAKSKFTGKIPGSAIAGFLTAGCSIPARSNPEL